MKVTILHTNLNNVPKEVDAIAALCKWQLISYEISCDMSTLRITKGRVIPVVRVEGVDLIGYQAFYNYLQETGYWLI